jgi:hypothetical protein
MKTFYGSICLAVLVMAFAPGASTGALKKQDGVNFRATLPAAVTGIGGDCCFLTADFAGTAVVPMLGLVTFTGTFVYLGSPGQTQPCELIFGEVPCEQRLFIDVVMQNGHELTIRGDDFWSPPADAPATWSWTGSGFATGSGTYSTTLISGTVTGEIGQPLTIRLVGTLLPSAS